VEPAFDYLVVSDLHLRGGFNNPTQGLYHFDAEFADFLRYYRLHRSPSQRWRLVIGGDFIEFLYITDLPNPKDRLLRVRPSAESEYRYGANTEAQKSRWKLDTILRSGHPQLLLALARFVLDGNEIVILRGNHDIEMSWPEVQEHFRRLIAEHHPADVAYMTMKELVAERVQFPQCSTSAPASCTSSTDRSTTRSVRRSTCSTRWCRAPRSTSSSRSANWRSATSRTR